MNAQITDPAVTLTDYGLAVECAVIVGLLLRTQVSDEVLRIWLVVFFGAASAASLLGGTVHGFFKPANSRGRAILWPATLISILGSGLAVSFIAAHIELNNEAEQMARAVALVLMSLMALAVLFASHSFAIAIAGYVPPSLFLLHAFISAYERSGAPALRWGIAGVLLSILGAAMQRLRVGVHGRYLDHNAFYHVIQGVAFWMIYKGAHFVSTTLPSIGRTDAITS
ncbi:MAG: DUF6962 family protein [Gemmatimonadaceae bacterium]